MIDTVMCPACRRALRVPDTLRGQLVKCPACEQTFTATEELEAAPRRVGDVPAPREEPKPPPEERFPANNRPRRPRDDDDDDDDRVSRPRSRRRDDDDRVSRDETPIPGKVQAIAILTLIGGIVACLIGLMLVLSCFGLLWPGTYYTIVTGILCIIKGAQLLSPSGRFEAAPTVTAVMQTVNVINLDLINLTLGILNLVFLNDPQVRKYYRG